MPPQAVCSGEYVFIILLLSRTSPQGWQDRQVHYTHAAAKAVGGL